MSNVVRVGAPHRRWGRRGEGAGATPARPFKAGVVPMNFERASRFAHALLRIVTGLLLLQHGGQKLFGWFGGLQGGVGETAQLLSQMGLAGVLEFFGGIALAIGLFTRPAAFLLSGLLAVAYFQAHQPQGVLPIQNRGELAVVYSFVCLFFAARGAGPMSLDGLRHRRRR